MLFSKSLLACNGQIAMKLGIVVPSHQKRQQSCVKGIGSKVKGRS